VPDIAAIETASAEKTNINIKDMISTAPLRLVLVAIDAIYRPLETKTTWGIKNHFCLPIKI